MNTPGQADPYEGGVDVVNDTPILEEQYQDFGSIEGLLQAAASRWAVERGYYDENTMGSYSTCANPFLHLAENAFWDLAFRQKDRERPARPNGPPPPRPVADALRWEVFETDDFRCRRCGTRRFLTVDHIIPRALGGTNDRHNLQTLCKSCNSAKGARV